MKELTVGMIFQVIGDTWHRDFVGTVLQIIKVEKHFAVVKIICLNPNLERYGMHKIGTTISYDHFTFLCGTKMKLISDVQKSIM